MNAGPQQLSKTAAEDALTSGPGCGRASGEDDTFASCLCDAADVN